MHQRRCQYFCIYSQLNIMTRSRQSGFALLELLVVMLVTTLLAVWASDALVRRAQEASAQAVAVWMLDVRKAAGQYLVQYAQLLRESTADTDLLVQGYANWRTPTLAELKQDGLLSAGYPEVYGRDLRLHVRVLSRGVCPGDECAHEAVVYLGAPLDLALTRRVNEGLLATWLISAGGQGGLVSAQHSGRFAGASFSYPNPLQADLALLPVGTVGMAVTQSAAAGFPYLKEGDERDPRFASTLSVAGETASATGVRAQSSVWVGGQAVAQTPCAENGLIVREQFGGLLVCRSYQWRSAGGKGGGGFSVNTVSGCLLAARNPLTNDCSCPAGYATVLVSDSGPKADAEGRTRGYMCVG